MEHSAINFVVDPDTGNIIEASMDDKFACALNHELDEEGFDDFIEFWSFILLL